jgi:hypothetical protein
MDLHSQHDDEHLVRFNAYTYTYNMIDVYLSDDHNKQVQICAVLPAVIMPRQKPIRGCDARMRTLRFVCTAQVG